MVINELKVMRISDHAGNVMMDLSNPAAPKSILDPQVNKINAELNMMSKAVFETQTKANLSLYAGSGQCDQKGSFEQFISGDSFGINALFHTLTYPSNVPISNTIALPLDSRVFSGRAKKVYFTIAGRKHAYHGANTGTHGSGITSSSDGVPFDSVNLPKVETNGAVLANAYKKGDQLYLNEPPRELITNGTFANGITGWAPWSTTATVTAIPGKIKCDLSPTYPSPYGGCWIPVNMLDGQADFVTFDLTSTNLNDFAVYIVTSAGYVPASVHTVGVTGPQKVYLPKNTGLLGIMFYGFTATSSTVASFTLSNVSFMTNGNPLRAVCLQDTAAGASVNDVFQAFSAVDSLARKDFMFLESWVEDVATTGMVYPLGNVQWNAGNVDTCAGIANGTFAGADTYSRHGDWQAPGTVIGMGYVWANLTLAQQKAFAGNPDNNIYLDGDKVMQARYRTRVVNGLGNPWYSINNINHGGNGAVCSINTNNYLRLQCNATTVTDLGNTNAPVAFTGTVRNKNNGEYGNGDNLAIPIMLVQRRNPGIYHPVYNRDGCAMALDTGVPKFWYETALITSAADCFNPALIAVIDTVVTPNTYGTLAQLTAGTRNATTAFASGTIRSGLTGREDKLYVDEVSPMDVEDKRMNANRITDANAFLDKKFNEAVSGTLRGQQGTPVFTKIYDGITKTGGSALNPGGTNGLAGTRIYFPSTLVTGGSDTISQFSSFRNNGIMSPDNSIMVVGSNGNRMLLPCVWHPSYTGGTSYFGLNKNGNMTPTEQVTHFDKIFPIGTVLSIYGVRYNTSTQADTITTCDIIGDPRNIQSRVKYTIVAGTAQVVSLAVGDVIVAPNGTYYSAVTARTVIDLSTDILTNAVNWVSLGTVGTAGGYPTAWLQEGITGIPLLTDANNQPITLANHRNGTAGGYTIPLNKRQVNPGLHSALLKVVVTTNGVSTVVPYLANNTIILTQGSGIGFYVYAHDNALYINPFGTGKIEPLLETNTIIQVFYTTKAKLNITGLSATDRAIGDGWTGAFYSDPHGSTLIQSLIDKVPGGLNGTSYGEVDTRFSIDKYSKYPLADRIVNTVWGDDITHAPLTTIVPNESPRVKILPILQTIAYTAWLGMNFKEIKYDNVNVNEDGTPTNTFGDDSKFSRAVSTDDLTDLNGNHIHAGLARIRLQYFLD